MNIPVWGISKWRDFETCPAMYHAKYITKEWKDTPNGAMERGRRVHKAFEDAIKYELKLPAEFEAHQPTVDGLVAMKLNGATVVPEFKFGVSANYGRVDYFDGDRLRVRCGLDVYVLDGKRRALIIDWKTGKPKQDHRQDAEFYGACVHTTLGSLATDVLYYYVDEPSANFLIPITDATAELSNWWQKFDYADKLIASGNIPANTCNACSWCGAFKCPRNKNRKLGNG